MSSKIVCFYHTDLDGFCAGAIVACAYHWNLKLIPINYGDEFPWSEVDADTEVWMVDFCLPKFADMVTLNENTKKFVWIDHHKSAIEEYEACLESGGSGEIEGIRLIGVAGCQLTWEYVFPEIEVPRAVNLLGAYDVWRWKDVEHALEFNMGMRLLDKMDPVIAQSDESSKRRWNLLLGFGNEKEQYLLGHVVAGIIDKGDTVIEYNRVRNAAHAKSICFQTKFRRVDFIAANVGDTNSQFFDSVIDDFPNAKALMNFSYKKDKWVVSLYSIPGRDSPDLSAIAKTEGGGGHAGAAGFEVLDITYVIPHLKTYYRV